MNKNDILFLSRNYNINLSKKLGQNFLLDKNLLHYIIKKSNIKEQENIVEIGPGTGILTNKLIEAGAFVTAIEYDRKLCKFLKDNINSPNFYLIEGDACKLNLSKLLKHNKKLISNLPYSISTPLLANILQSDHLPSEILLLLQKETADRFIASSNTKQYGAISALLQNIYKVEYLKTVPPQVFYPQPKVNSAIIKLYLKEHLPNKAEINILKELTKKAFSQRRKLVKKNLNPLPEYPYLSFIFSELNISLNLRAEQIPPDKYLELARKILKIREAGR